MPAIRFLLAAPLVALLGAAMAIAAWPEGDVTSRDRELVARLTRGGAQRLEADGGHWTTDAVDLADAGTPVSASSANRGTLAAGRAAGLAAPSQFTTLPVPESRPRPGRPAAPPGRDRAPPRL